MLHPCRCGYNSNSRCYSVSCWGYRSPIPRGVYVYGVNVVIVCDNSCIYSKYTGHHWRIRTRYVYLWRVRTCVGDCQVNRSTHSIYTVILYSFPLTDTVGAWVWQCTKCALWCRCKWGVGHTSVFLLPLTRTVWAKLWFVRCRVSAHARRGSCQG